MVPEPTQNELDFPIVSPRLTLEAMRDSGYKDTDHGLAELIDNAVEAQARSIEIFAVETPPPPGKRYARARVSEIAVADDGVGMDWATLRRALKFGDGTRLGPERSGIGRFGIGLPQSSISQCKRVDVWTWQNGAANALHCYLDLEEIKERNQTDVPAPEASPLPDRWQEVAASSWEQAGTLVVWSKLDRVSWRGGGKTLERTADLCGRVYRKFLAGIQGAVEISLVRAREAGKRLVEEARTDCLPNDPLYLMSPSSTPEPFSGRSMFRLFSERSWSVPAGDRKGDVHIRCTLPLQDAIREDESSITWPQSHKNPGDAPWGKHASRNKGISIVRAGRELELSQAWVNSYEPEERWWSVEVEFDPVLDEIFGVVNNKQHALGFTRGAGFDWKNEAEGDETRSAVEERFREAGDPREHLGEIWTWLDGQIVRMRQERKRMVKGSRGGASSPWWKSIRRGCDRMQSWLWARRIAVVVRSRFGWLERIFLAALVTRSMSG